MYLISKSMPKTLDVNTALDRAQWLCSQSERCVFDISQKLRQWGFSPDDSQKIVDSLIKHGFIDEERYAQSFAREKARFNRWGPRKIEMALRAKRLSDEHIQLAISEIQEFTSSSNLEELISKKAKSIKFKDTYDLKSKLLRFGMSRGFEYAEVTRAVEKVVSEYK